MDEHYGGIKKGLSICEILRDQPYYDEWREQAFRASEVFDGEGLAPEMIDYAEEIGMPTKKINLCKSTVMTVIGHSEKLRTDVKIGARTNDHKPVAQAANELLHQDWSICKVNNTTAEVHLDQMVNGIGWYSVKRNPGALRHQYAVNQIPAYEMKWDTYSMRTGFENCRWVCREQAYHEDYLKLYMPQHTALIDSLAGGHSFTGAFDQNDSFDYEEHFNQLYDEGRRMVIVREAYERVPERRKFVEMDDGTLIEDRPHIDGQRVERNVVVIKKSFFLGPVKVNYSDHTGPNPPLIPMLGYKMKGGSMYVGPMYDMIDPAYNYNFVTNQQLHILSSSKLLIKPDSLHDDELEADDNSAERVRQEVARRDTMLMFKEDADLDGDIKILREWEELSKLQALKQDSRQEIRDVSGIVAAFSGASEQDMSGVAIENSAKLGSTNMAYLLARKSAAEIFVAEQLHAYHLEDDNGEAREVEVKSPMNGQPQKITLNQMHEDGTIGNQLARSKLQITMSEVTASAGYREQSQMKYQDLIGQLANTEYVGYFVEAFLRNEDAPGIDEILAKFQMQQGGAASPEEMKKQMATQAEQTAQDRQMEQAGIAAETNLKHAQAEQALGIAESSRATARKTIAGADSEEETPTAKLEAMKLKLEMLKIQAETAKIKEAERNEKLAMLDQFTGAQQAA